jgi:hypothetical protein
VSESRCRDHHAERQSGPQVESSLSVLGSAFGGWVNDVTDKEPNECFKGSTGIMRTSLFLDSQEL